MRVPDLAHLRQLDFLGNSLEDWALALLVTLLATAAMAAVRALVLRRMAARSAATETRLDDLVVKMLSRTYLLFIVAFGVYFGSTFLELSRPRALFVSRIAVAALLMQVAVWGDVGLRAWRNQLYQAQDSTRRNSSAILGFSLRLTLWVIVFLMVLDNFGVNITALVASLGVGGIAVALAVQNILGDLFASLSITLDKPFEIGDFIIVGEVLGSVEHIGLKTTRVRGLGGEQVVFSNGDLLKSRIHNHKRMETRRVAFVLRVAYGVTDAQLARVPLMIREVVDAEPMAAFERAHFFNYGEWSLNIEVVYHFQSPDYIAHMDTQQAILLEIYRRFAREGIQFAHPLSIVRLADAQALPQPEAMRAALRR